MFWKKTLPVLALGFLLLAALAAETAPEPGTAAVPEAIGNFIQGLNENSYGLARNWISPDFNLPQVPSEVREPVFKQLFAQWPVKITSYSVTDVEKGAGYTDYTLQAKLGARDMQIIFTLDKKGRVQECSLFSLQAAATGSKQIPVTYAEIPIEMYKGVILCDGEVDGVKGKFLLDTGAPTLVLNSPPQSDSSRVVLSLSAGAGGASPGMDVRQVKVAKWGGGTKLDFSAITMDLSHLANPDSLNFLGIIGMDMLEPYETHIDVKNLRLYLYALDAEGNYIDPQVSHKFRKKVAFTMDMHLPTFKIKLGKLKVLVGLDTGASSNTLPVRLFEPLKDLYESTAADSALGIGSEYFEVKTAVLRHCEIAGDNYPGMGFAFVDNPTLSGVEVLKAEGLLGSPFYTRQRIALNYRKKLLGIF